MRPTLLLPQCHRYYLKDDCMHYSFNLQHAAANALYKQSDGDCQLQCLNEHIFAAEISFYLLTIFRHFYGEQTYSYKATMPIYKTLLKAMKRLRNW